jgi:hypothetical protein
VTDEIAPEVTPEVFVKQQSHEERYCLLKKAQELPKPGRALTRELDPGTHQLAAFQKLKEVTDWHAGTRKA